MPYGFHSPQLLLIHLGTTMTKLWTGTWHWCLLLVFTAALSTTQGLLQGDVLLASFNASSYQVGASTSCGPEDAVISSDCLPDSPSWCAATANASEYLEASLVPLLEASAGKGVGEIVLVHAGSSLSNIKTVNVPGVQRCFVEADNKPIESLAALCSGVFFLELAQGVRPGCGGSTSDQGMYEQCCNLILIVLVLSTRLFIIYMHYLLL